MHIDQKVQIVILIADKALYTILAEYLDFKDVFSKKSAIVLPEHTEINTYTINLEESKQLPYRPIYSLRLVELETFKTYIETNLVNSFICVLKISASTPILFDKKLNGSFWLCVNYWDLNNITIKKGYPFLLVSESFNCLDHAK